MRREVFIEKITLQLNACGKFKRNVISVIHNLVSWNADLGQILSLRRQNPKVDFIRWLFTFSYSYMLLFERCWIVDTHTKNKHRHHHHQLGIIMSLKLFFWLTSVTICCIVSISAIQPLPTGESSAKANTVCKFVERNQLKIMTLLQRIVFFVDSLCVSFQCLWAIIHLFLHSFCFCCIFFFHLFDLIDRIATLQKLVHKQKWAPWIRWVVITKHDQFVAGVLCDWNQWLPCTFIADWQSSANELRWTLWFS